MTRIKRWLGGLVKSLTGYELQRSGSGAFSIQHHLTKKQAWSNHRCQLEALIDELNIGVILDVGANIGQFAQNLRQIYQGPIHSFEPVRAVYNELTQTAADDPHWHTHRYALGREDSDQDINVAAYSQFSSLLEPNAYSAAHFGDLSATATTECVRVRRAESLLDKILIDQPQARIFLKMDTQGFDLEAFAGFGSRLENVVAIQSEVSVLPIYDGMPHWTDSIAVYERAGYSVVGLFPVNRQGWKVIEFDCLMVRDDVIDDASAAA